MKNKKGMLASTLVTVIVIAVVFIVVLRFYAAIIALMKALGENYFWCLLKKVISAYTKVPLIGAQVWSAFCAPVVRTITLDATLDEQGGGLVPINTPLSKRELKNLEEWYPGESFEEREEYLQYRLDEVITKGLKRCWGRNGQGELPLGSEWNERFWSTQDTIFYCDLCAIYNFDEEIQQIFNEKGEMSLNKFLKNNPVRPGSSESTWEYLKDDDYPTDLKEIKYSTDSDLAFVYTRGNRNNFNELLRDVFVDILPKYGEEDHPVPIDAVILTPFENFENLKCTT